ncbi:MAG: endonuclease/exonuclease/phosphatase family protein [Planctomycetota bacterium]
MKRPLTLRMVRVLCAGTVCASLLLAGYFVGYQRGFERGFRAGQSAIEPRTVMDDDARNVVKYAPVTLMAFNIHHGQGLDGRLDLARIAEVIRRHSPDIVALQEVDRGTKRSGVIDQLSVLAQRTKMHAIFGKAKDLEGGEYGNGLLAKEPIEFVANTALPGGFGREPRSVLVGRVYFNGPNRSRQEVVVLSTHLDFVPGSQAQLDSAKIIGDVLNEHARVPVLLAGDMNAQPESETIRRFQADWVRVNHSAARLTYPSDVPKREIDHVFFAPADRWVAKELLVDDDPAASDHRALIAELELLAKED